ncbi:unnamed protein product [Cunninghamella blakesleeana]
MTIVDSEPLLPTTNHTQNNVLKPLPPSYEDGAIKYYLIWTLRFFIFAMSGSLSLKLSEKILDISISSKVPSFVYILILLILETLVVYPFTILIIGTLLGQSKFYGRIVYKGWGRFLLPTTIKEKWLTSSIWI